MLPFLLSAALVCPGDCVTSSVLSLSVQAQSMTVCSMFTLSNPLDVSARLLLRTTQTAFTDCNPPPHSAFLYHLEKITKPRDKILQGIHLYLYCPQFSLSNDCVNDHKIKCTLNFKQKSFIFLSICSIFVAKPSIP